MPPLNKVAKACLLLGAGSAIATANLEAATVTVNVADDGVDDCTLREAINAIGNGAATARCTATGVFGTDDTIVFDETVFASSQSVVLSAYRGSLQINALGNPLSIVGSGADQLTIDGNGVGAVFRITNSEEIAISDVTITGGSNSIRGGGIDSSDTEVTLQDCVITGNHADSDAGGIHINGGALLMYGCEVSNNYAGTSGGAMKIRRGSDTKVSDSIIERSTIQNNSADANGGGIYLEGYGNLNYPASVYITDTTISGNTAINGSGGGFLIRNAASQADIVNSTISANAAPQENGGGIGHRGGTLYLVNTTVANNIAPGSEFGSNSAGGISVTGLSAVLTMTNSILADSQPNPGYVVPDCAVFSTTSVINTYGNNLIELDNSPVNKSCGNIVSGADVTFNQDPGLQPLADNGGPTQTHALLKDSFARDAGDNALCVSRDITTDQRGEKRSDGSCDLGSFELEADSNFFVIPLPNGKVITFDL